MNILAPSEKLLFVFVVMILITSCGQNVIVDNEEISQQTDSMSSLTSLKKLNQVESNIERIEWNGAHSFIHPECQGPVIVNYQENELHGPFRFVYRGKPTKGQFKSGKLQGYIYTYYDTIIRNDRSSLLTLHYFENGEMIWSMFPAADFGRIYPVKGIRTKSGKVRIDAVYENQKPAYQGTFIDNIAIGTHYSFDRSGFLRFEIDYSNHWCKEYDSSGSALEHDTAYSKELTSSKISTESSSSYGSFYREICLYDHTMKGALHNFFAKAIELGDMEWSSKQTYNNWIGYPPASESEIQQAENRLGTKLPSDYRQMLKLANGFPKPCNAVVPRFFKVSEIDFYKNFKWNNIELWKSEPELKEIGNKLERSIIIGGDEEEQFLLIPPTDANKAWEYWLWGNWIPGERRYPDLITYFQITTVFLNEVNKD